MHWLIEYSWFLIKWSFYGGSLDEVSSESITKKFSIHFTIETLILLNCQRGLPQLTMVCPTMICQWLFCVLLVNAISIGLVCCLLQASGLKRNGVLMLSSMAILVRVSCLRNHHLTSSPIQFLVPEQSVAGRMPILFSRNIEMTS